MKAMQKILPQIQARDPEGAVRSEGKREIRITTPRATARVLPRSIPPVAFRSTGSCFSSCASGS